MNTGNESENKQLTPLNRSQIPGLSLLLLSLWAYLIDSK